MGTFLQALNVLLHRSNKSGGSAVAGKLKRHG